MKKDDLICEVWYNYSTNEIRFKNYSDEWDMLPFGRRPDTEVLTADIFDNALLEYVFPETRYNCKELLALLGIPEYDPLAIIRTTHGVMANSSCWIKFDDDPEELCWNDFEKYAFAIKEG